MAPHSLVARSYIAFAPRTASFNPILESRVAVEKHVTVEKQTEIYNARCRICVSKIRYALSIPESASKVRCNVAFTLPQMRSSEGR